MGLPTARVRAGLRCSAPGGHMAPRHYRASRTRAPPIGRPRPTSSWLSELTPRPPLSVSACACLSVRRRRGGSIRPDAASHSAAAMIHCGVWWCEDDAGASWLAEQQSVSVSQTDSKATQQVAGWKYKDGRERTRPTAPVREEATSTVCLRLGFPACVQACLSPSMAHEHTCAMLPSRAWSGAPAAHIHSRRPAGSSEKSFRR